MSRRRALVLALLLVAGCGRPDPRLDGPIPTLPTSEVSLVEVTSDVGVTADAIHVGILADLSGPRTAIDVPLVDAQKLYWAEVNRAGGVGGRLVELTVVDTGSDLEAHRSGYRELIDEVGVVAIGYSSGTEATLAIGPLANADQVLVISGSRHSTMITQPAVLSPHASLCVEAINTVSWLDQRVRAVTDDQLRLAIVGDGTPDADDAVAGARLAAVSLDLNVVVDHSGSADLAVRLQNSGATGVFVAGDPGFLEAALEASDPPLTGPDVVWTGSSLNLDVHATAPAALSALVSNSYFHPWPVAPRASGNDDVVRISDVLAAGASSPSDWSLIGWAGASLLFDALTRSAVQGDMQRLAVLEAASSGRARFDGLAPPQTWRGNRADRIVRDSGVYDLVDWGDPASVQLVLAGGPDPSETARSHQQEGPCVAEPIAPRAPAETPEPDPPPEE